MRTDHELLVAAQEAYFGHEPMEVSQEEWDRLKELLAPEPQSGDALLSGAVGHFDGVAIKVIGPRS